MTTNEIIQTDINYEQIIIERSRNWFFIPLREIWNYRELLFFLVWRDLKVRYKQTILGASWILFQPLLSTLVFSFIFGGILNVNTGEVPYPVFALTGLIAWNYFASSVNKSSTSLILSSNLITKVYFPRIIIPISGVLSGLVDFSIAFLVLIVMMVVYQVKVTILIIFLPLFLLLTIFVALGFSLWLSALNVRFRDINYLVPFLVQIWMYITPVIYPSAIIPDRFQFFRWFFDLNPMTGVIEGFRWVLLGAQLLNTHSLVQIVLISIGITLVVLISGIVYFRYTERTFADII